MYNIRINNEINLTYPDSFSVMGEEELTRYFSSPANRWGAYDADRHIVLSVGWAKAGFKNKFTDAETYLFGIESRMCRNLLNYQQIHTFKIKIGSKKAQGVRFEYRVKDAALVQVADMIVFKYKGKFYTIHYISRKKNAAATRPDFEQILKSITLG